ncbi:hypothetical protein BN126350109 [Stenotrophomonas thermophila]|nr:hypothetical protein BN126350109 [Stenotrophomonas maltophilia]
MSTVPSAVHPWIAKGLFDILAELSIEQACELGHGIDGEL